MVGLSAVRRREEGAAAVEFGLVLVPLLTILFGIISYGYMLSFRQSISQAAAEGARAAAVAPATADREAIAYAAIAKTMGVECQSAYLSCEAVTSDACATCLAVTVTYDYAGDPAKLSFPGTGVITPDELSFTSTVELSQ